MAEYSRVVAIDGPSGSGKSTVAKRIAETLGLLYVDTGAMFRALAIHFHRLGLFPHSESDEKKMERELNSLDFCYGKSKDCLVEINGQNLTQDIRQHFVSDLASQISKFPSIRVFLQKVQHHLVEEKVCVMEGRDIGTVIFPRSFCKVFLTASLEIRAQRRLKELQERGQKDLDFEKIKQDLCERDERDRTRVHAPLKMADDAFCLDTTSLTLAEVTKILGDHIKKQAQETGIAI